MTRRLQRERMRARYEAQLRELRESLSVRTQQLEAMKGHYEAMWNHLMREGGPK